MIEATVPERRGDSYVMVQKMVFNNIVHFTPADPKPKWYSLTDQQWARASAGWRKGTAIIGNRYFDGSGLWHRYFGGTHEETASVVYALSGRCTAFEAIIGPKSDSPYSAEPTEYRIYVNGVQDGDAVTVEPFTYKKMSADVTGAIQIACGRTAPRAAQAFRCSATPGALHQRPCRRLIHSTTNEVCR